MKVLLFGSTGLLGAYLQRYLKESGCEVIPHTRDIFDLVRTDMIPDYIEKIFPDVVINAAALSNVDRCEDEKDKAFLLNGIVPGVMAHAAAHINALFIHVSTDYVFPGGKSVYHEHDLPNPISTYGESKLFGEREVQHSGRMYYIIRTSLLFREGGNNFLSNIFEKIKNGEEVLCTADRYSAPTYVPFLSEAIYGFLDKKLPFGIYHVSGGKGYTACQFAELCGRVMGIKPVLKKVSGSWLHQRAQRPNTSVLSIFKFTKLTGIQPLNLEAYLRRMYERVYEKKA